MKMRTKTKVLLLFVLCFTGITKIFAQDQSTWSNDVNVNPQPGKYYRHERMTVAFDGTIFISHLVAATPGGPTKDFEILMSSDGGWSYDTFAYATAILPPTTKLTAFDMVAAGNDSATFKLYFSRCYLDTAIGPDSMMLTIDTFNIYSNSGQAQYSEKFPVTDPDGLGYTSVSLATDSRDANNMASLYFLCVTAVKAGVKDSIIVFAENPLTNEIANRNAVYSTSKEIRNVSSSIGSADPVTSTPYGRLGIAWDEYASPLDEFGGVRAAFVYPDDATIPLEFGPYIIGVDDMNYRKPSITLSQAAGNIGPASFDMRAIVAYEYKTGFGDIDIMARVADSIYTGTANFNNSFIITSAGGDQVSVHSVYDPLDDRFIFTYFNEPGNTLSAVYKTATATIANPPISLIGNYRNATTAINTDAAPRVDVRMLDGKPALVWNDNYETFFDAEYLPASVAGVVNIGGVRLYPNPATNFINMDFSSIVNDRATVIVYDMTGRQLVTQEASVTKGTNKVMINLQELPAGNYILQMKGSNTDITSKFVIMK
jgi:hypothetical protein